MAQTQTKADHKTAIASKPTSPAAHDDRSTPATAETPTNVSMPIRKPTKAIAIPYSTPTRVAGSVAEPDSHDQANRRRRSGARSEVAAAIARHHAGRGWE